MDLTTLVQLMPPGMRLEKNFDWAADYQGLRTVGDTPVAALNALLVELVNRGCDQWGIRTKEIQAKQRRLRRKTAKTVNVEGVVAA